MDFSPDGSCSCLLQTFFNWFRNVNIVLFFLFVKLIKIFKKIKKKKQKKLFSNPNQAAPLVRGGLEGGGGGGTV